MWPWSVCCSFQTVLCLVCPFLKINPHVFYLFIFFIPDFIPGFSQPELNWTCWSPTATLPADVRRRWQTRDSSTLRDAYSRHFPRCRRTCSYMLPKLSEDNEVSILSVCAPAGAWSDQEWHLESSENNGMSIFTRVPPGGRSLTLTSTFDLILWHWRWSCLCLILILQENGLSVLQTGPEWWWVWDFQEFQR